MAIAVDRREAAGRWQMTANTQFAPVVGKLNLGRVRAVAVAFYPPGPWKTRAIPR